jgi:hypothetical protein
VQTSPPARIEGDSGDFIVVSGHFLKQLPSVGAEQPQAPVRESATNQLALHNHISIVQSHWSRIELKFVIISYEMILDAILLRYLTWGLNVEHVQFFPWVLR